MTPGLAGIRPELREPVSKNELKEGIARQFDRGASTYDRYADVQNLMADRLLKRLGHRPGIGRVLEVGCGTGLLTAGLLDAFPDAGIIALDLSAEMVKAAARRVASPRVELVVADAEEWDGERGLFDVVVSNATAQWFERPEETMAKLAGSLSPGGLMAHSVFGPRTFFELHQVLDGVEGRRGRGLPLLAASEWTGILRAAGLRGIQSQRSLERRRYPDLASFLETVKRTGAGYARPASADQWDGFRTLRRAVGRSREESRETTGLVITYEVVEVWGIRPVGDEPASDLLAGRDTFRGDEVRRDAE